MLDAMTIASHYQLSASPHRQSCSAARSWQQLRSENKRCLSVSKEACDKPTPQGYSCSFDWQVVSTNLGASMYKSISSAFFHFVSGKWAMRLRF
jgi:hypothetical protein